GDLMTGVQTCALPIYKFRQDHRQGILGMTLMHRVNVGEYRAQQGAVRRLNDEQMGLFLCCDLVLPLLPACPYLLDLLVVDYHMRSEERRVGQGGEACV